MRDPIDDIGQLRDDIDSEASTFLAARQSLAPVTAKDSSGALTVTLDPDGKISAVVVSVRWADTYSSDSLAGGINEAVTAAAAARLETFGTAVVDPQTPPERLVSPLPHEGLAAQLRDAAQNDRSGSTEAAMETMRDLLHELTESVDQVMQEVDAHLVREFTGKSASGHAKATISGNGTLLGLVLDRDWLDRAHPTNIGREATQAIQDGYRRAGSEDVNTIIARSPLGRLQRLSEDPVGLARELGLRD